jgi:UDP-N-acetylglucosamine acyltransferase
MGMTLMMPSDAIHPLAVVDPAAHIHDGVSVGPFCVVGPHVTLHRGVRLISHVVVDGHTVVGEDTVVYPFASLGTPPQDLKYAGETSYTTIGARTVIREHVTINSGTAGGGFHTRVGDDCLLMVGVHVAHDGWVHNRVIMANNATLAGHVVVEEDAVLGGLCAVHQFVRIGRGAMIGGLTGVEQDVLPYALVMGERGSLRGLNLIGLKRSGHSREAIADLQNFYHGLFKQDDLPLAERLKHIPPTTGALSQAWHSFLQAPSKRGLCVPSA